MSFTIFDIIILSILTASSLLGVYRGFIKVSVGFIAFILSLVLSYYLYPYAEDFLSKHLENEMILVILSGTISYILSLVVCGFFSSKLIGLLQNIGNGVTDRFLGLVIGFIRGGVICLVLFVVTAIIATKSYLQAHNLKQVLEATHIDNYPCWLKESMSTPYLNSAAKTIIKLLPNNYLEDIALPTPKEDEKASDLLEKTLKKKRESQQPVSNASEANEELNNELDDALP